MTTDWSKRLALLAICALSVKACGHTTLMSDPSAASEVPLSLSRPEACDQFKLISWYGGRPSFKLQDVYNALNFMTDESDQAKYEWLREVTGDTSETINQIKSHNAAWRALCGADQVREKGNIK